MKSPANLPLREVTVKLLRWKDRYIFAVAEAHQINHFATEPITPADSLIIHRNQMWLILILLIAGTLTGILMAGRKKFNFFSEKITGLAIYILLFFMGLSVGSNPEIMRNLSEIGLQSLIIAAFAVAGSIILSGLSYYFFFRNEK